MSGICAVWGGDPGKTATVLTAVSSGLRLATEERLNRFAEGVIGLGVSSRFASQQLHATPHVIVACDADLCNTDELWSGIGSRPTGEAAELIAELYARQGQDFVEKLRGNFSFILWDKRQHTLIAAVDGFGAGRLVYYQAGSTFVIASRIHALLQHGEVQRRINPKSIANILNFTTNLAPGTIIEGVQRLLPGTALRLSNGAPRVTTYWDMRYGTGKDTDESRLSKELSDVVERSVEEQSKTAGSIGAFLSGGTDSSTVVGMMARASQEPVKTFSIGFEEQSFNELGYAEIAAKRFQTDHHVYLVSPKDCFEALPKMVRYFDEPFGNSSAIPTYFCARLAAQHGIRTLLAGDGGDELFGGNERYATDRIFETYQSVPRPLRKGVIEPVLNWLPVKNGLVGKARSYTRRSNMPALERFYSYNFLCTHPVGEVFEGDFQKALAGYSILETPSRYYENASARHTLDRFLYVDVKITLGDSDLPKVTCMSELAGVQTRFPLLDRPVAEFSGRIPPELKLKGYEKRYLFKRAFQDLLPPEIIAKKKHGFGIPVADWMKSDRNMREMARDTLLSQRAFERGYFRRQFIEDLFRKHESDSTSYYGDTIWTFLVLELWHREFVDQAASAAI